jgi:hypothetical protein
MMFQLLMFGMNPDRAKSPVERKPIGSIIWEVFVRFPGESESVELKPEGRCYDLGPNRAIGVHWVFADMTLEAGRMDMLSLVLLWPFAIRYFKFTLQARRLLRALQEWDQNSK